MTFEGSRLIPEGTLSGVEISPTITIASALSVPTWALILASPTETGVITAVFPLPDTVAIVASELVHVGTASISYPLSSVTETLTVVSASTPCVMWMIGLSIDIATAVGVFTVTLHSFVYVFPSTCTCADTFVVPALRALTTPVSSFTETVVESWLDHLTADSMSFFCAAWAVVFASGYRETLSVASSPTKRLSLSSEIDID